jgi:hypothetical protein
MRSLTLLVCACILLEALDGGEAEAGSIDFQAFNVNDLLATVNAGVAGLGVSFDAVFPSSFVVALDPVDASNRGVLAQTCSF